MREGNKKEKLSGWIGPVWSTRAVSLAINFIFVGYLTFYCTDVVGMNPTMVGILLLVSKLFDGITDLVVGFIIDNTHTKWGKARPYEVFIILAWIFTVLLFTIPRTGEVVQAVYLLVMYTLVNSVCITFLNGSEAVYLLRAIKKEEHRISILSISGIFVMIFSIAISIVFPQLLKSVGTSQPGWTKMAISFAVMFSILGSMRFFLIKEELNEEKADEKTSLSFKNAVSSIMHNKYIIIIASCNLIASVAANLGTATTYYFKYIVGDIGLQSITAGASLLIPFALIAFPFLSKKKGNGKILQYGAIMACAGYAIRAAGGTNMVTLLIGTALGLLGVVPMTTMVNAYAIDCMDYGEYRTGKRVEGLVTSLTSFAAKVGGGLASGLTGLMMGMAGYDGNLKIQPAEANQAIIAVFNYLPLVLIAVMVVLSRLYKLDKQLPEIRKELGKAE